MMIAARDFATARALIDRGVASDASQPEGAAYLLETSDSARNVRKTFYPQIAREFSDDISVHIKKSQSLKNANDVMFYFTGLIDVPDIASNRFLPGAVADHLTSFGGQLTDSSQMSALRWLEVGATGSYGTVVEPCAFVEKFPNPLLFMQHYLVGETLVEAYWKSVYMPGQGVFIGEPLARPYGAYRLQRAHGHWYISGSALRSGNYQLFAADNITGPFERIASSVMVNPLTRELELPEPTRPFYRLERVEIPRLIFNGPLGSTH